MTHPLPLSEDAILAIKNGCEGVTPGPWEMTGSSLTDFGREWPCSMSMEWLSNEPDDPRMKKTGEHLARLDPQTVSALCDLALTALRANSGEVTEAEVDAAKAAYDDPGIRMSAWTPREGIRGALKAFLAGRQIND